MSLADPPFAAPAEPLVGGFMLDLPQPLSVNRLWRSSKSSIIKSREYNSWVRAADGLLLEMRQARGISTIMGRFSVDITVKRSNLDLDNNAKCVLDYLQSRRFISDDKHCEMLTLRWGAAPTGCRVIVKPWHMTMGEVARRTQERLEGSR